MLRKIAPILPTLNISTTNLFYSKLKFNTQNYGNYLVVQKELVEIHFYVWPEPGSFVATSCYIYDDNIEDLYTKFSSMDVVFPMGNLRTNIWGKMEFQVVDNNGNVLKFAGT